MFRRWLAKPRPTPLRPECWLPTLGEEDALSNNTAASNKVLAPHGRRIKPNRSRPGTGETSVDETDALLLLSLLSGVSDNGARTQIAALASTG